MNTRISIRSYNKKIRSHYHLYHQLVMPLHGTIDISIGQRQMLASVGDCVIIKAKTIHQFRANELAKFIVIDSKCLPENFAQSSNEKILIDDALLAFIQFIEIQLNCEVDQSLEQASADLLFQLLAKQSLNSVVDKRIEKTISLITQNIAQSFSINALAKQAYLSTTQFKKQFKENTGLPCNKYITQLRMKKAKALLVHTDTPISIIAEKCGFQSPSAFSRAFKAFYGQPPKEFNK